MDTGEGGQVTLTRLRICLMQMIPSKCCFLFPLAGIFSDTHLLAMMYCGEMCYWGLKYCGDQGTELHRELPGSSENIIMDFQEIGEKMLTKYIAVCEGPLRSHGWDTKNAKRILDYFKQLSS